MKGIKTVFGYTIKDGPALDAKPVDSAALVFDLVKKYRNKDREHFLAIYVNARSQPIALDVVSVGTLSASLVHPREVFKGAFLHNAAAVILAHNHPSGDVTPSAEDQEATRRMRRAGELLGVPVLDHVIVGARNKAYTSFKERGLLS